MFEKIDHGKLFAVGTDGKFNDAETIDWSEFQLLAKPQ